MLKRVVLFLATNLAVLALLSIIMSVFNINPQGTATAVGRAVPPAARGAAAGGAS